MHTLTINSTNLSTYGIFLGSETYLDAPLIDYTAYDIPAKNGSVIQYNKRLNNVIRRFDCYIPETGNVQTSMDSLKKLLYSNIGYMKLESSYDTDTYQEGYLAQEISVAPFNIGQSATFSLYFSCKPQKWFKTSISDNKTTTTKLGMWGTYSRTSSFIQSVFAQMNASDIPDDEFFFLISFGNTGQYSSGVNITDISASFGTGFISILTVGANMADMTVDTVLASSSTGSVSASNFTTTDTGAIMVLVPCGVTGTVTGSAKIGGTTNSISFAISWLSTLTNLSAYGLSAEYQINYYFNQAPTVGNCEDGNVLVYGGQGINGRMYVPFSEMTQTQLDSIYASGNTLRIKVIPETNTSFIVDGLGNIIGDASGLLRIEGAISGFGDTFNFMAIPNTSSDVIVRSLSVSGKWWKL